MNGRKFGSVVRFVAAVLGIIAVRNDPALAQGQQAMIVPRSGARVVCARGSDGVYRFSVNGSVAGVLPDGEKILLWVKPVHPSAGGWYLQRPPGNGISAVEASGAWRGTAQIGNVEWPPHDGDTMDIIVTAIDRAAADRLLAEPGGTPRGQPSGRVVAESSGVIVGLQ
jgi:hypothetical protein